MKRSPLMTMISFVLAVIAHHLIFNLAGYDIRLFKSPFSLRDFGINLATFVGLAMFFRLLLEVAFRPRTKKPEDGREK